MNPATSINGDKIGFKKVDLSLSSEAYKMYFKPELLSDFDVGSVYLLVYRVEVKEV